MTRVLNIPSGGLRREGITSTQLVYAQYLQNTTVRMDMVATHNNDNEVIDEFRSFGCTVFELPDRRQHLMKYCFALFKTIKTNRYDVVHVHGSSSTIAIELFIARIAGVKKRIAHSRNTKCNHIVFDRLTRFLLYKNGLRLNFLKFTVNGFMEPRSQR